MFAVPGPGPCSCVVTWPSIRSSVAGTRFCTSAKQLYVDTHTHIYIYTYIYIYIFAQHFEDIIPVVPHKAVAEVSKIGNL